MAEETQSKETEYEKTNREGRHGAGSLAGIDFKPDLLPVNAEELVRGDKTVAAVQHPDAIKPAETAAATQLAPDVDAGRKKR